jgi:hypothetical protein
MLVRVVPATAAEHFLPSRQFCFGRSKVRSDIGNRPGRLCSRNLGINLPSLSWRDFMTS